MRDPYRLWSAVAHSGRAVERLLRAATRRAPEALTETLRHEGVDDGVHTAVEVRHQRERLSKSAQVLLTPAIQFFNCAGVGPFA